MIRRPPRSTQSRSSAASDVYKRQTIDRIIYHTSEGSFDSGVNWLTRWPTATDEGSSTHYFISADGKRRAQLVRERDAAWTAGNREYNLRGVNIELEGYAALQLDVD